MTADPHTIGPEASWAEAMALMDRLHVRHVPVVDPDSGRIVGLVTARDMLARRNEYLNRLIEERTGDLREAYERLQKRDRELQMHLALAGRLQARLLPSAPPDWPEIAWGMHYAPLDPLGGDYYDFAQPDERHLGVLIADASGHSIPAAMVAIMAHAAFAQWSPRAQRPAAVLAAMNRNLHGLTDDRFVTAFYGIFDRASLAFTYANAGHPQPLHLDRQGRCRPLEASGLMLGVLPDVEYHEHSVRLQPGDRLCLFTDGASECKGPGGKLFGVASLIEHFQQSPALPPAALAQQLVRRLEAFRGPVPQSDDLTLLIAEVRG
jgi:serine phosphatase RsbU (regulator of sigma subunit)